MKSNLYNNYIYSFFYFIFNSFDKSCFFYFISTQNVMLLLIFMFCCCSLMIFVFLLMWWSSNSNCSVLGMMFFISKIISYEVSVMIIIMNLMFKINSFNLNDYLYLSI